jgi:L-ascorbate oxidase
MLITVENRLPEASTTIHWHGIHQIASPHMDGVPFVTQCPILPGNSFRYRMIADVSGTHVYHSHVGKLNK